MVLWLFVSLTGYFLFIAKISKWPIAVVPFFTVCLIPGLLYVAGIFNLLPISAHILFYTGIVFFLAYLLLCFQKRQVSYTEIFSPGLVIFVFYFFFLYLVCRSMSYCGWDEFSHWGLVTKDIVLNNKLPDLDSAVVFKSYPPGIALFHYFIVSITGYSEGMVLFAHNLFMVSAFIAFFQKIKWKQFYLLVLVFLISHSLFYFFSGLRTGSLMADPIVGTVFGMSITGYFLFDEKKIGRLVYLIPILFFLPLTKPVAIYLALCVCMIIGFDYLYCLFRREFVIEKSNMEESNSSGFVFARCKFSNRTNIVLSIILLLTVISAPLVSHFTWKVHLNKYKVQEVFKADFSLEQIKNTFFSNIPTSRDKETINNFKKALYKKPIVSDIQIVAFGKRIKFDKLMSTISCFFICLITGIISILFQSTALNRRRVFFCQIILMLFFLIYCFIHLLMYLYSFGDYEGPRIASFGRYMSIFFLGWFYVLTGSLITAKVQTNFTYRFSRWASKILLFMLLFIFLFSFKYFLFGKKPYLLYRYEVEKNMPLINKFCPLNSKVYFIYQNDETHGLKKWIFSYEVCPRRTNIGGWSIGKPYDEGDVWTTDYTPEQLLEVFSEYDYVLIAKADEKFFKKYGVLFGDIKNSLNGVLFKVVKMPDGKISVEKISQEAIFN